MRTNSTLDNMINNTQRKIIHIDMDCFYAAVEIRDTPDLKNKPVAVGGNASERGVLCTCNYIARKFGVHSAMPTATAIRLCPDLILLPVNMAKYKLVSRQIQAIFREFTDLVEPLSLDEAYLDVTDSAYQSGSATLIAEEIRKLIWERHQLTASAGVASNKFLAKIASGWNKPNGICVISPNMTKEFVAKLEVSKLFGVGKVTAEKLHRLNIKTCSDLCHYSLAELCRKFGKLGNTLYYQARGIDNRSVEPNRLRKSLSVERTFAHNIEDPQEALDAFSNIFAALQRRLAEANITVPIKAQFIKIKFKDFTHTTAEQSTLVIDFNQLVLLFNQAYARFQKPIRLLGAGVVFDQRGVSSQQELF